ncbi:MAG: DinB family protein [Ginsengibacter sp.]
MSRPKSTDYPSYYEKYVNLVPSENIHEAFAQQDPVIAAALNSIDEEKANYAYGEGKWTVKELIQHCIDAERVFAYRLLGISRGDQTSFPSFDQDPYVITSKANDRKWEAIKEEMLNVRASNKNLVDSLDEATLQTQGLVNNNKMTALNIGYIILGHMAHHLNILKEKY